jgi:hypothetical protein
MLLQLSRRFALHGRCVRVASIRARSSLAVDDVADVGEIKDFESIPGPVSLPVIGTIYKYIPFCK